ncbi:MULTISPECIES: DUF7344 domain-containing protein [Halorussus]|uniref:DUF7344 domain-containing protein n=1 Tax=Halorussus TaxID=1070314 RepID=UPI00209D3918|nr:hypothetical protein [Halorussus vallis]USZ75972.1 hypothetical protein NGM07_01300 [Halorussus vallis]
MSGISTSPTDDTGPSASALDFETRFDLLSSSIRRRIVVLLDESGTLAREELTANLAPSSEDSETDVGAENETAGTRRVRISLEYNHLPRLAEAGVVEYDDETVTATPQLASLAEALKGTATAGANAGVEPAGKSADD